MAQDWIQTHTNNRGEFNQSLLVIICPIWKHTPLNSKQVFVPACLWSPVRGLYSLSHLKVTAFRKKGDRFLEGILTKSQTCLEHLSLPS